MFNQIIGLVGMVSNILSFQQKKQKAMILMQFCAAALFCIHYFLLGATTGFILNLIAICRAFVFSNKEHAWARKKFWLYLFVAAYVAVYPCVFAFLGIEFTLANALLELLPVIGMVCSTIGYYMQTAAQSRKMALINSPCWLLYNFINFSIGGVLTECFCITSIILGMIRHDRKK